MIDLEEIGRRRSAVEQKLRDAEGRLSQLDGRISELCVSLGFASCPSLWSLSCHVCRRIGIGWSRSYRVVCRR